jgi:S-DNA-T family DNA segregation ATPase FtsK/SpoIIIE
MQQKQITTAPSTQYGQGAGATSPAWQPSPYPVQQGAPPYPISGGWGGYGQVPMQAPAGQPQPYQPAPQYPQPYQPAPQQYQQPAPQYPQYQYQPQPQYPPAQRPWGVPEYSQNGAGTTRQSIDNWQRPGQSPGWNPPAYNGYSGQNPGQSGGSQNNAAPVYYW